MNIGQSQSLLSLLQKEITSDLVEKTPKKKIKIDPLVVIEEIFDNQEDLATADPLDEINSQSKKQKNQYLDPKYDKNISLSILNSVFDFACSTSVVDALSPVKINRPNLPLEQAPTQQKQDKEKPKKLKNDNIPSKPININKEQVQPMRKLINTVNDLLPNAYAVNNLHQTTSNSTNERSSSAPSSSLDHYPYSFAEKKQSKALKIDISSPNPESPKSSTPRSTLSTSSKKSTSDHKKALSDKQKQLLKEMTLIFRYSQYFNRSKQINNHLNEIQFLMLGALGRPQISFFARARSFVIGSPRNPRKIFESLKKATDLKSLEGQAKFAVDVAKMDKNLLPAEYAKPLVKSWSLEEIFDDFEVKNPVERPKKKPVTSNFSAPETLIFSFSLPFEKVKPSSIEALIKTAKMFRLKIKEQYLTCPQKVYSKARKTFLRDLYENVLPNFLELIQVFKTIIEEYCPNEGPQVPLYLWKNEQLQRLKNGVCPWEPLDLENLSHRNVLEIVEFVKLYYLKNTTATQSSVHDENFFAESMAEKANSDIIDFSRVDSQEASQIGDDEVIDHGDMSNFVDEEQIIQNLSIVEKKEPEIEDIKQIEKNQE